MEALGKLGIDGRLLIAQILNFGILLFLLHRFLYKPLLGMLEKRRVLIEKSLEEAKAIQEKLASVEQMRFDELQKAKEQAAAIVEQATKHAEEKSVALIEKAKNEVHGVVQNAREKIRMEKEQMLTSAKQEFSALVLLASEQVLKDVSDKELSDKLREKALSKVA
ncbi:F0F1 ATP synthase subunit B [Candidatus Uhrbacteria bacterium]|nr:F0F1 ATP synthase subunit B [Candidatus Uhrbacteria bacterium]